MLREVKISKKPMKPIDRSAVDLADKGVLRVRIGLSMVLACFTLSLMFASPITARIANYGLIAGGMVSVNGFMLLFMAQYLLWFCIGVAILFAILVWARKHAHSDIADS